MILTQTLYSKVSSLVAQREIQSLEETMALAQSVTKLAHARGVELEGILEVWKNQRQESENFCDIPSRASQSISSSSLVQSWSRLGEEYQALCRQLEAVESSMPAVGLVEETEERLVERIGLYQARNRTRTGPTETHLDYHSIKISIKLCLTPPCSV